jgi:WD40 repeat protein
MRPDTRWPGWVRHVASLLWTGTRDSATSGYTAFMSYSHALDGTLAPALQAGLEQFGRAWYQRRAIRVFRDDTNLSATPDLWASIEEALSRSTWLILLASPDAAASPWVNRELEWWLAHRSPNRLLIGLTAGELHWDEGRHSSAENAVSTVLVNRHLPEPRWIDFRPVRTAHPSDPQFQLAVAELAAPLHGVPKDSLIGEQVRQHRIRKRWIRGVAVALATLTILALAGAGVASVQRNLAVSAEHTAVSQVMVNEADEVRAHDPRAALRLGLAAWAVDRSPAAKASLLQTLTGDPAYRGTIPSPNFTNTFFAADSPVMTTVNTVSLSRWDLHDLVHPRLLSHTDVIPDNKTSGLIVDAVGTLGATYNFTTSNNQVTLWDLRDPQRARPIGHPFVAHDGKDSVRVVLSPDGRYMAATAGGIEDPAVSTVIWDISDPQSPRLASAPILASRPVPDPIVDFSPDSKTVVVVDNDDQHTAVLWDVAGGRQARPLSRGIPLGSTTTPGIGIMYAPDGRTFATWGQGTATLWDATDRTTLRNPVRFPFDVNEITAFAPDESAVIAVETDRKTIVVSTLNAARTVQPVEELVGHTNSVYSTAFMPGSNTLVSGSLDGSVILWSLAPAGRPQRLGNPLTGHTAGIGGLAFNPNGDILATAGIRIDNSVLLWDVSNPKAATAVGSRLSGSPGDSETYDAAVAFTSDGRTLAMADNDRRHVVDLWNVADPRHAISLGPPLGVNAGDVTSVAFSRDGRLLAAATGKDVVLWDVTDPHVPRQLAQLVTTHSGKIVALGLTPDAQTMVTASADKTLQIWDIKDPARPQQINRTVTPHTNDLFAAALSADGKILATGGADRFVQVWDLADPANPRPLGQPLDGADMVVSLAFAPDGGTLAVGDVAGATQLWDVTDPARARPLGARLPGRAATTYGSGAYALAFSPNSRLLAVGDYDDTTTIWDLDPLDSFRRDAPTIACEREGHPLDKAAWSAIAPDIPYVDPCAT